MTLSGSQVGSLVCSARFSANICASLRQFDRNRSPNHIGQSNGSRTEENPSGDLKNSHIGVANVMANRLCVFAIIAWVRGVNVVFENQMNTLFFSYEPVKEPQHVLCSERSSYKLSKYNPGYRGQPFELTLR